MTTTHRPADLTIIHVTDMHLHVDAAGIVAPLAGKGVILQLIRAFADGRVPAPEKARAIAQMAYAHSQSALIALGATLQEIWERISGPSVVVQGGDVEAYGPTSDGRTFHFRGFDYWDTLTAGHPSTSIYGNHDVWPGAFPANRPLIDVEPFLRARPEFQLPLPDQPWIQTATNLRVEIYRLNTVLTHWFRNSFANGEIQTDQPLRGDPTRSYPTSESRDPVLELAALAESQGQTPDTKVVRIINMHYPPYYFNARWARLSNPEALLPALSRARFHLILAGHRHEIDPAPGTTITPRRDEQPQRPLPFGTLQLVAGTATQDLDVENAARTRSFSVYELHVEHASSTLNVFRTIYYYESDADTRFVPAEKELVVRDMQL